MQPMKRSLRAALAAAMVFAAPISFAANLVPNPDFTQLLTGWSPAAPSGVDMTADFSTGSPAQPSAHVTATAPSTPAGIVTSCMPVDGLESVSLGFNVRVVAGVAAGSISAYSDAA